MGGSCSRGIDAGSTGERTPEYDVLPTSEWLSNQLLALVVPAAREARNASSGGLETRWHSFVAAGHRAAISAPYEYPPRSNWRSVVEEELWSAAVKFRSHAATDA